MTLGLWGGDADAQSIPPGCWEILLGVEPCSDSFSLGLSRHGQ